MSNRWPKSLAISNVLMFRNNHRSSSLEKFSIKRLVNAPRYSKMDGKRSEGTPTGTNASNDAVSVINFYHELSIDNSNTQRFDLGRMPVFYHAIVSIAMWRRISRGNQETIDASSFPPSRNIPRDRRNAALNPR